jgi:hypothetical protein
MHVSKAQQSLSIFRCIFDFMFIDCTGYFDDTYYCLINNKIRKNGIIGVHDYGRSGWPGVKKATDQFCFKKGFKLELIDTLAVLSKKGQS